jgi:hypothetical protein
VPVCMDDLIDDDAVCCICSRPVMAHFCRANRAEQCRLLGEDRPTYAQCEFFAFLTQLGHARLGVIATQIDL